MISIGNSGVPGKKKPKLTVVIAPLGKSSAPPADEPEPEHDQPAPSLSGSKPDPAVEADATSHPVPKPGESLFHDQSQSCGTCEYFNPSGHVYGECLMHVPEADFSVADPDLSWCKYYEDKKEDQGTPETSESPGSPPPPAA